MVGFEDVVWVRIRFAYEAVEADEDEDELEDELERPEVRGCHLIL